MDATLSSKGQMTIPKQVREHLHAKPGDKLRFFLRPDGGVVILPVGPITRLKGSVPHSGPPLTDEEIRAGIEEGATMRWRRFAAQTKEERKLREKTARIPAAASK